MYSNPVGTMSTPVNRTLMARSLIFSPYWASLPFLTCSLFKKLARSIILRGLPICMNNLQIDFPFNRFSFLGILLINICLMLN